jgi:nicotinamide riboside transporter PnuC
MTEIFLLASIAATGCLFLVFKFGRMRRVLAFDALIDIGFTLSLCLLMAGTFSGIMIALVAGAIISVVLWTMKRLIGTDILTAHGWEEGDHPVSFNNTGAKLQRKLKEITR